MVETVAAIVGAVASAAGGAGAAAGGAAAAGSAAAVGGAAAAGAGAAAAGATATSLTTIVTNVALLASAAVSVGSTIASANNQSAMAKAQARYREQEARDRAVAAGIAAERRRRQYRLAQAEQAAGAAEAGVLSGSTLDLLDANSVAFELDALTLQYNGMNDARALRSSAGLLRADAGNIMTGGTMSAIGAGLGATPRVVTAIDGLNF